MSFATCSGRHTFKIVVGGMQWLKRSYNFARTCRILAGVCSAMISSAICAIRASQSGGGMGVLSVTFSLRDSRQLKVTIMAYNHPYF